MEKWKNVHTFLTAGSYPLDYDKSQRQTLRRYASKFQIKDGELFFGTKRRVIKSMEEAMLLFKEFHYSPIGGHTGIRKTREAISSRFYWHGMSVDIQNWVLECDQCQKVGKPLIAPQPLECIKVSAVWELIGIDLTGPLPITADGFQYILTATDYFSKWVEAFPLKSKSAAEVGRHLCSIIYRHGCPKRILSDQGREFVNELNHRLCEVLQIERSVTAAYHPQTNGLDEKTNDNIKRALKKLVNEQQSDWDVYLDATLFSLRSKVHTTTKHSPFLLMYGREAVFPSEVPVHVPLSSVILRDEGYSEFAALKMKSMKEVKKTAEENIIKSQEKQKASYAKKTQKKYQHVVYNVGDEVLLLNLRKLGRKGGRIEPDFTGPYFILAVCGKLVTLKNSQGVVLKNKYSTSHLKPYKRSQAGRDRHTSLTSHTVDSCSNSKTLILPPCSPQSSAKDKITEDWTGPILQRSSVIQFCPPKIEQIDVPVKSTTVDEKLARENTSTVKRSTLDEVFRLWASKDSDRVEAVIGPYKLYDSSFRTLQGTEWLADEVIDAYLHHLIAAHKKPAYQLSAVVASSLFAGQFRCVSQMKFPVEDIWLCPVNTGAHWILVIIDMKTHTIYVTDPLGKEGMYERRILRNWRNFLKIVGHKSHGTKWHIQIMPHNTQQDSTSCGLLVMKFAEHFLLMGELGKVMTTPQAVRSARTEIACLLLENKGNAEDYCIVCSMVVVDADESMIEMVQCDGCSRWAHVQCAQYHKEKDTSYLCKKCSLH